jgi:hypothetical protein
VELRGWLDQAPDTHPEADDRFERKELLKNPDESGKTHQRSNK